MSPRALSRTARTERAPRVLCISGPNLQLLGTREPEIYGSETLAEIHARLKTRARALGASIVCRQTNHEGAICDWLAEAKLQASADGVLLNAGAYTHTSIAIHDAIKAIALPVVEVHLSNPDAREEFRRHSAIAPACFARVAGFGGESYLVALDGLLAKLAANAKRATSAASTNSAKNASARPRASQSDSQSVRQSDSEGRSSNATMTRRT